ncbi:MAG: TonB-dependent receptor [Crocinitomicaceae bacterium]|nr:TonB-dependent receptor [Crocinitomicaceae bacterium]MBK8927644.1 TonB-dependent receptor [Crocinitomicaceae bacterium]
MKNYILLLSLVLSASVFSQGKKTGLQGVVTDEAGNAVPYATILLYTLLDSTLKDGASTNDSGQFILYTSPGNYYLKVRFLSFEEQTISTILIDDGMIVLDTISLKTKSEMLDVVDVTVEKPQMELKLDKRVFNIQQDLSNVGLNASEILDNIPSISVDAEGNVTLRGSQNVRILINGKPSALLGLNNADALRQINGSMIERVEVITNPSARYDAEGEVGIINIILKEELNRGFNGSFNARVAYPFQYGAGFNVNFRTKKVNYFLGYGFGRQRSPGMGYTYQRFDSPDTAYLYRSESEHERGGFNHNINAGVDFNFTKKISLTLSSSMQFSNGDNWSSIVYEDLDSAEQLINSVTRDEVETDYGNSLDINLNFRKTFDQKERLWTVDVRKGYTLDNEQSLLTELTNDVLLIPIFQRTTNNENESNWLFQTDYVYPFGEEGKFEIGAKVNLRSLYSDYLLEDSVSGDWQTNDLFNNQLNYIENIYAAYIMAGNKYKKFSVQLGLRAEYSNITTKLVVTDTTNQRRYLRLFPSVHVSYELKKNNYLQVSYSRRISRPRYWWLTPFYTFRDSRNFESGNPNINPEYAGSYELGHLKYWKKGSMLTSLYYRHTVDVMDRILLTDSTGLTYRTPVNLGNRDAFGVEISGSYEMYKWWNISGSLNLYRAISEGTYNEVLYTNDVYAWSGKASSKFNINRKISIQTSFTYESPQSTNQGSAKAQYFWDASGSLDILKGNGTLSLNARDILNSRKRRNTVESEYFYSYSEFQWRSRQITLNFVYRINQKKGKNERPDFGDGGDGM